MKYLAAFMFIIVTQANAGLYGSVIATSNYDFRRISSSDNKSVVQGTLGWKHESGAHIDSFFSPSVTNQTIDSSEADLSVGFGRTHGSFSWDISLWSYHYLHYGSGNYVEFYLSASYKEYGVGFATAPNYFGDDDNNEIFYWFSYLREINKKWYFDSQIGIRSFDKKNYNNGKDDSYLYYHLGITRTLESDLSVNIKYVATDLKAEYHSKLDRAKMVVILVQSF